MHTHSYHRMLDLVVAVLLGAAIMWYLSNAVGESLALGNLMLIVPVSAAGFLLLVYIIGRNLFRFSGTQETPDQPQVQAGELGRHLQMLVLIVIYILALGYVYFDVATAIFGFCLMMLIKRDSAVKAFVYAAVVAIVICFSFRALVPYYPFPMFLGRG